MSSVKSGAKERLDTFDGVVMGVTIYVILAFVAELATTVWIVGDPEWGLCDMGGNCANTSQCAGLAEGPCKVNNCVWNPSDMPKAWRQPMLLLLGTIFIWIIAMILGVYNRNATLFAKRETLQTVLQLLLLVLALGGMAWQLVEAFQAMQTCEELNNPTWTAAADSLQNTRYLMAGGAGLGALASLGVFIGYATKSSWR
jgi:hypothetical protein